MQYTNLLEGCGQRQDKCKSFLCKSLFWVESTEWRKGTASPQITLPEASVYSLHLLEVGG